MAHIFGCCSLLHADESDEECCRSLLLWSSKPDSWKKHSNNWRCKGSAGTKKKQTFKCLTTDSLIYHNIKYLAFIDNVEKFEF